MPSDDTQAQLKRVQAELKRAQASLSAFGSAAHHDLNAPLRHIRMFAELIERDGDQSLSAQSQDYLKRIEASVDRSEALVEALTEYARLTGAVPVCECVDLTAIAKEVAGEFADALAEVGGTVEIGALPAAFGDPVRVKRVLACLFDNAIIHRQDYPVHMKLAPVERASGKSAFTISDTGPGLPAGREEAAFELLRRCHSDLQVRGVGVGLALSRQLMEAMGGSIEYEPGDGAGASFVLTLPASA